jgi:acyl phosphate:glycerol-3-phosphate acyltransferase
MRLPLREAARKVIHLAGALIPLLYFFLGLSKGQALLILGTLMLPFAVTEFLRLRQPAINRWFLHWFRTAMRPEEEQRPTGALYYLLACWVTILVFDRTVAVAALLVLACGDTAASIVGQLLGGYRLGRGKTLSGTLAFVAAALGVTLPFFPLPTALSGAVVAAVTECIPLPLNDNITIPLAAGLTFTLLWAPPF